jgi:diguanylate cyclase (GGDEF)-like protein
MLTFFKLCSRAPRTMIFGSGLAAGMPTTLSRANTCSLKQGPGGPPDGVGNFPASFKFVARPADDWGMNAGTHRDTRFSRASHGVLEHLSITSGLPTWLLTRTTSGLSQALAVVDPSGAIRPNQSVPHDVGEHAGGRLAVPVILPEGDIFGELVGFGATPPAFMSVESLRTQADAFAAILGALADSERTLAIERRASERIVAEQHDSLSDPLTGLATRQGWEQRLRRDEVFCSEFGEPATVLVIEMDDLKRYNELHGHSAGDEQLRIAGSIVRSALDEHMFGARLSGDHIAVLAVGTPEHLVGELERTIRHAFSESEISVAVGLGRRHPEMGLDGAMLEAEDQLATTHATRQAPLPDATEASAVMQAIELGDIKAYFQPIVDLRTGAVVSIEALARWSSRDGVREPDQFLRIVQQAGLSGALFDRILDDGLENLAEFRHIVPNLTLAVNFEFDDKLDNSFYDSIVTLLAKHKVPAQALSIELGERQTFDLPSNVRKELSAVAGLGVQLVLDDFGTGFASLETLTSLPISGVKLDRKFTSQVVNGDREPVVVKAMIAMATEAGLSVIAEGIETQLQCDRLVRLGCRLGQGYLFALPQPADSLSAVLSAPLVSTF